MSLPDINEFAAASDWLKRVRTEKLDPLEALQLLSEGPKHVEALRVLVRRLAISMQQPPPLPKAASKSVTSSAPPRLPPPLPHKPTAPTSYTFTRAALRQRILRIVDETMDEIDAADVDAAHADAFSSKS